MDDLNLVLVTRTRAYTKQQPNDVICTDSCISFIGLVYLEKKIPNVSNLKSNGMQLVTQRKVVKNF